MRMLRPRLVVGGSCVAVLVGRDVAVGGAAVGVIVTVPVGGGVSVGKAVGGGNVGKGVDVGNSNSNRAVGVGCPSIVGRRLGLDTGVGELREGSRLARTEQQQQNANRNRPGKRILPS